MFLLISETKHPSEELKNTMVMEIMKRGGKVAYISSDQQTRKREWFQKIVQEYNDIDSKIKVDYFDLSESFSDNDFDKLINYGTLHLSGGSTYKFIVLMRKRNFKEIILKYIGKGGLVIGVCAGGIVLTPTIKIIEVGVKYEKDKEHIENYKYQAGFNNFTGLDLVPFEFFPHFDNTDEEIIDIQKYVNNSRNVLYACGISDGILIEDDRLEMIGNVRKFTSSQCCT